MRIVRQCSPQKAVAIQFCHMKLQFACLSARVLGSRGPTHRPTTWLSNCLPARKMVKQQVEVIIGNIRMGGRFV